MQRVFSAQDETMKKLEPSFRPIVINNEFDTLSYIVGNKTKRRSSMKAAIRYWSFCGPCVLK